MNKTKLIIHEKFNGNQTLEDVFLSAFQSESYQLLQDKTLGIIDSTEQEDITTTNRRDSIMYPVGIMILRLEGF